MPKPKVDIQGIGDARKSMTQLYLSILVISIFLTMSVKSFNQQIITISTFESEIYNRQIHRLTSLNRLAIFLNQKELRRCLISDYLITSINRRFDRDHDLISLKAHQNILLYLSAKISYAMAERCVIQANIDPIFDGVFTYDQTNEWERKVSAVSDLLFSLSTNSDLPASESEKFLKLSLESLGVRPKGAVLESLHMSISNADYILNSVVNGDDLAYRFIIDGDLNTSGTIEGGGSGQSLLIAPLFNPISVENQKREEAIQSIFLHSSSGIPTKAELSDLLDPNSHITTPTEDSISIPFTTSTIEARFVILLGGGIIILMYSAFLAKFLYVRRETATQNSFDGCPTLPLLDASINPVIGASFSKKISSGFLVWNTFIAFPIIYFSLGLLFRFNFVELGVFTSMGGDSWQAVNTFVNLNASNFLFATDVSNIIFLGYSLSITRRILMSETYVPSTSDRSYYLLLICVFPVVCFSLFPVIGVLYNATSFADSTDVLQFLFHDFHIYSYFMFAVVWFIFAKFSSDAIRIYFACLTWLLAILTFTIIRFQ